MRRSNVIKIVLVIIVPCAIIMLIEIFKIVGMFTAEKKIKEKEELNKKEQELEELRKKIAELENNGKVVADEDREK